MHLRRVKGSIHFKRFKTSFSATQFVAFAEIFIVLGIIQLEQRKKCVE